MRKSAVFERNQRICLNHNKSTTALIFDLKIRLQTLLHIFYQSVELQLWWTDTYRPRCAIVSVDNDDPTPTFTNVSATHEKVAQIANLLKEWHWSFSTLTYEDDQQAWYAKRQKEG